MTTEGTLDSGCVAAMWRYPVKSMIGEELDSVTVTERGLWGDRAFAIVDGESGKIVSAKNPRKWGDLFAFRSELAGGGASGRAAASRSNHVSRRIERNIGRPGHRRTAFRPARTSRPAHCVCTSVSPRRGLLAGLQLARAARRNLRIRIAGGYFLRRSTNSSGHDGDARPARGTCPKESL